MQGYMIFPLCYSADFLLFSLFLCYRYIDNVCKKLSHFQALSDKAIERSMQLEEKRSSVLSELSSVGPQTAALIQLTKSLQQRVSFCLFSSFPSSMTIDSITFIQIENNLSLKYKNRPVNIMGGVQVL